MMGEPQVKRLPFSPHEDSVILEHVQQHGPAQWQVLAKTLANGRTAKSCRLRWYNELSPGIDKSPIGQEEMDFIMQQLIQRGTKWSIISKALVNAGYPKRTDNAIKNLYHVKLKRIVQEQTGLTHHDLQQLAGRKKAKEISRAVDTTPSEGGTDEQSDAEPDLAPVSRTNSAPAAALSQHLGKGPKRSLSCLAPHVVGHKRTSSSVLDDNIRGILNASTEPPVAYTLQPPATAPQIADSAAPGSTLQAPPGGSGPLLMSTAAARTPLLTTYGSGPLPTEALDVSPAQAIDALAQPLVPLQFKSGHKLRKAVGASGQAGGSQLPSPSSPSLYGGSAGNGLGGSAGSGAGSSAGNRLGGQVVLEPGAQPVQHPRVMRLRSSRDLVAQPVGPNQPPPPFQQGMGNLGSNSANSLGVDRVQELQAGHMLTSSGSQGAVKQAVRQRPGSTDSIYSTQRHLSDYENGFASGQAHNQSHHIGNRTPSICSSPSFAPRGQLQSQQGGIEQPVYHLGQDPGVATASASASLPAVDSYPVPPKPPATLAGPWSVPTPHMQPPNTSPFSSHAGVNSTAQLDPASETDLAGLSNLISAQVALTNQLSGQLAAQGCGAWLSQQSSMDPPALTPAGGSCGLNSADGSQRLTPAGGSRQLTSAGGSRQLNSAGGSQHVNMSTGHAGVPAPSSHARISALGADLDMGSLTLSPDASCHPCGSWADGAAEAAQDLFGQLHGPASSHSAPAPQSGPNPLLARTLTPARAAPMGGMVHSVLAPHNAPTVQPVDELLPSALQVPQLRQQADQIMPPPARTSTVQGGGIVAPQPQCGNSAVGSGSMNAMAEELAWSQEAASNWSLTLAGHSTDSSGMAGLMLLNSSAVLDMGLPLPTPGSTTTASMGDLTSPSNKLAWQGSSAMQVDASPRLSGPSLSSLLGNPSQGILTQPSLDVTEPRLGAHAHASSTAERDLGLGAPVNSLGLGPPASGLDADVDVLWPDVDRLTDMVGLDSMDLEPPV